MIMLCILHLLLVEEGFIPYFVSDDVKDSEVRY